MKVVSKMDCGSSLTVTVNSEPIVFAGAETEIVWGFVVVADFVLVVVVVAVVELVAAVVVAATARAAESLSRWIPLLFCRLLLWNWLYNCTNLN